MTDTAAGATLEARSQRLYLAQGSFAERGLLPAATPDRRMLATDIDVLVSEYGSGFNLTRRHVECKSGKFPLLDRILWLNGVRTLLRADSSYLIAADVDLTASDFARTLDVQLFTIQHLDAWEKSLGIPADVWPCRSDLATFEAARAVWNRLSTDKADESWRFLRAALAFVEVESWLRFRYRLLNKLIRLLGELGKQYDGFDTHQALCARYIFSALLVRMSQYLLAICADVSSILPVDVEKYLTSRLTFGDQDPTQATDLTKSTVAWVRESLRVKGITMPAEIEPTRLHVAPPYAPELVSLVRRLLDQSQEARYLPLAAERMQFGLDADDKLPRFRAAAASGDSLAALLKGFAARTFKAPSALAGGVHEELMAAYQPAISPATASTAGQPRGSRPTKWTGRQKWPDGQERSKGKEPKPPAPSPERKDAIGRDLPTNDAPPKASADLAVPDQQNLLTLPPDDKK